MAEGYSKRHYFQLMNLIYYPETISVRALDEKGGSFDLETSGFLARVIQHEIDHLNGLCFIDRVTDTRRLLRSTGIY